MISITDGVATLVPVRDAGGADLECSEHGPGAPEQAALDSLVAISESASRCCPGSDTLAPLSLAATSRTTW